jgi:hypothetical protein
MQASDERKEKIPLSEVGKLYGKKRPDGKIRGEKKGKYSCRKLFIHRVD